jgi:hypothetical protein
MLYSVGPYLNYMREVSQTKGDNRRATYSLPVSPLLSVDRQVPSECRFEELLTGAIDIELLKRIALPIRRGVDDGFVIL